ncbi:MAG: hypothetical protein PUB54_05190 [Lachnospiraceae bacterium]|nr:hypothetical protein [Lachnospiraceae bacterium]
MIWFVILLIGNLIVAGVYLAWNIIHKTNKNYIVGFVVMIVCPLVGPLFYLLAYLFYKLFFQEPVDLEDVIFSKERIKSFVSAEEESERNLVSLEEAIEITNEKELRTLMMNVVRGDVQKFLYSISLALNSQDTETAHYAASMLQDALNDFRTKVEKERMLVLEDSEQSVLYAETLVEYMNQVLEQRAFTDMEQRNFVGIMEEMCDILYQKAPGRMSSVMYEAISLRLLEIEEYDQAEKWCNRAKVFYPNTLASFTTQLKLYFASGKKEQFFETVEELKNSSVVVDNETLELLRVFK